MCEQSGMYLELWVIDWVATGTRSASAADVKHQVIPTNNEYGFRIRHSRNATWVLAKGGTC